MDEKTSPGEMITFLGAGGARFMTYTQLLATGGYWLDLEGTQILVDPGPGAIVQSTKRKLKAEKLSAIILSHRHLDHSADMNIMTEAMTQGGFHRHGQIFAPADALDKDPVILTYVRELVDSVEILEEGKSYTVGNVSFATPVRHIHPVETYGLVFKTARHTFAHITDTRYFDGLLRHYHAELLLINVVFLEPRPPSHDLTGPTDHLSVPDAEHIIRELKPKVAILTHFGMSVWRAKPWLIAERLSQETGVRVLAARDGMKFDLALLDGV